MRRALLIAWVASACGSSAKPETLAQTSPSDPETKVALPVPVVAAPVYPPDTYVDLASALDAVVPDDARVVGFGELHARTDRTIVRSSLSHFTSALEVVGEEMSDLVVETFVVDPKCGKTATVTTKAMETEVKRPVATKSEIELLGEAARANGIQPHAMTLSCADYKAIAPNGQIDPLAMLTITTRELGRITASAFNHRRKTPDSQRSIIAVYGGALHNDRFPDPAVAEWSYAASVDNLTGQHFVEVDIIVPELAVDDPTSQKQPWFTLVQTALAPNPHGRVAVFRRGERSFVLVMPSASMKNDATRVTPSPTSAPKP